MDKKAFHDYPATTCANDGGLKLHFDAQLSDLESIIALYKFITHNSKYEIPQHGNFAVGNVSIAFFNVLMLSRFNDQAEISFERLIASKCVVCLFEREDICVLWIHYFYWSETISNRDQTSGRKLLSHNLLGHNFLFNWRKSWPSIYSRDYGLDSYPEKQQSTLGERKLCLSFQCGKKNFQLWFVNSQQIKISITCSSRSVALLFQDHFLCNEKTCCLVAVETILWDYAVKWQTDCLLVCCLCLWLFYCELQSAIFSAFKNLGLSSRVIPAKGTVAILHSTWSVSS